MTNLTNVRHCGEMEQGIDIGDNSEGNIKVILEKYILDFKYEKSEDMSKFTIWWTDYDYSTKHLYLWQRIIINYIIDKGYKSVVFLISYPNIDLVDFIKEFTAKIDYPSDSLLAGNQCDKCIKRKECPELQNTYFGKHAFGEMKTDSQLFNTYNEVVSRRKALEKTEEGMKELLYNKILKANNRLELKEFGIYLTKKETPKDTLDFKTAQENGLINEDTVTIKITAVKEILKKDKLLASKVKLVKAPFKNELDIKNM